MRRFMEEIRVHLIRALAVILLVEAPLHYPELQFIRRLVSSQPPHKMPHDTKASLIC